jgi:hypothetical protein
MEADVNSEVWATQEKIGSAVEAVPVQIHLKDSTCFPHQRQYPLRPKVRKGL